MRFIRYTLLTLAGVALLSSCSSKKGIEAEKVPEQEYVVLPGQALPTERILGRHNQMPKALLYKTAGDYADKVPVQLNADGSLRSYPAPSDIPADATPMLFADGWLLSRVGVTQATVFTSWTFDEYRALDTTPTPVEIIAHLIPGAIVETTLALPMTPQEARADTTAVNEYILSRRIAPVGSPE